MTTEMIEPQRPPWISKEIWEDMRVFSVLSDVIIRVRATQMVGKVEWRMTGEGDDRD